MNRDPALDRDICRTFLDAPTTLPDGATGPLADEIAQAVEMLASVAKDPVERLPLPDARPVPMETGDGAEIVPATEAAVLGEAPETLVIVVNWSDMADTVTAPFLFGAEYLWGSDGATCRMVRAKGTEIHLPPASVVILRADDTCDGDASCDGCRGCGATPSEPS